MCGPNSARLIQDNELTRSSFIVQEFLAKIGIPTLPFFSPDIGPWDFFLFSTLKSHLEGTHGGVKEVKEAVTAMLGKLYSEDCQGFF